MLGAEHAEVNVFIMAERSQDDELSRTVSADIPLFAVAFVLMAARLSLGLLTTQNDVKEMMNTHPYAPNKLGIPRESLLKHLQTT